VKKTFKIFLVISIILLTGCLDYVQQVTLYPDGSGKMHIDYWMKLPDVESRNVANKIGIFEPDSIRSEFSSRYTQIENVKVYTDSTDSTTHGIVDFTFDRIDSLNKTKAFSDANFSFRKNSSGIVEFSQFIPPLATGFGIDATKYRVIYKYTFSGSVINNNANREEDNALIWNYTLADIGGGKTISVTFRPYKLKETPDWIYMLTGTVLAIVIFFLFRKKKD
jgi:hypothetical protein